MNAEALEDSLREVLKEDDHKDPEHGLFFPSEITGCPLKVFLNRMVRVEVNINSFLFQGSAVHFYLQQNGILDEALHNVGYHVLDSQYEVSTVKNIGDEIRIHGSCDILCEEEEATAVFDIKYSALPADSGAGRIYQYYAQANTYSYLFDADEYGLIMIHSRSGDHEDFMENIAVLPGEKSEDNWNKQKTKTRNIHEALTDAGYNKNNEWEMEWLENQSEEFWRKIIDYFDLDHIPTYDSECNYCPHAEHCPVNQGVIGSGLQKVINEG